jgi:hypothetical protein
MTQIKVNIAAMQQMFHACTPDFIRDVCQARCCRSTTDPTGIAVVVAPDEVITLRARGATIDDETRRIAPVARRCFFQSPTTHGCTLHETADKPRGCIISPLTVNSNNTLIVRNRYRLLPCFKADGAQPVYVAHRASLVALFGQEQTDHLTAVASDPARLGDTIYIEAPDHLVAELQHKNTASKS